MKNCLLTGGSGLIGSHLIPLLLKKYQVSSISRKHSDSGNDNRNFKLIEQDLMQPLSAGYLPKEAEVVIHLAQSEHYKDFPNQAADIFKVNTSSTLNLLEYAREARASTFIYASSGGVYGLNNDICQEDQEIRFSADLGFYLCTKLCSEYLIRNYAAFFKIVILRFFFVYGSGQRTAMLIPRLAGFVEKGSPILLNNDTGIFINPISASDAAEAIINSISLAESQIINVAGPEVLSVKKIGEIIGSVLEKEPNFQTESTGTTAKLVGSIDKMIELLGPPKIKFREGLTQYIRSRPAYE